MKGEFDNCLIVRHKNRPCRGNKSLQRPKEVVVAVSIVQLFVFHCSEIIFLVE
jgi:hypothetical protein